MLSKIPGIRKFSRSQVVASGEKHFGKKARPVFYPKITALSPRPEPTAKAPPLPEEERFRGLFNLLPVLHHTAMPTPTSGEISHAQKDLKVAIPGAQNLTRAQLERDNKLKEASELIDTELLELPQRKELIREDGSLDIMTTYYEGGTMITIPNVRTETVKDYRIKFGLETNEGGLPDMEKSQ